MLTLQVLQDVQTIYIDWREEEEEGQDENKEGGRMQNVNTHNTTRRRQCDDRQVPELCEHPYYSIGH